MIHRHWGGGRWGGGGGNLRKYLKRKDKDETGWGE